MKRLAGLLVCGLAASAAANGRPAATSTINFRLGDEQHIAAGMTFGLVLSHDGGATWEWMCESAVKYGGAYDPDYAYAMGGALFATTFDGALVNRDGCVFDTTPFGAKFVTTIARGPDNAIYMGLNEPPNTTTGDPGDSKIYKSTDEGATFPTSAAPAVVNTWWNSLEVAPTDADRVYASGYRLITGGRVFELHKSDDGGATFTPMALTGLTTTMNSTIDIVGISRLNPDHLYVRVTFQIETAIGDALFRSTNAGQSWTKILDRPAEIAFTVRANGDLVAGTKEAELLVSRTPSNGDAWETIAGAPHVNCLTENAAGEVWACTENFGMPGTPADGAGIMKSTTLATWTPVLEFDQLAGPVGCAAGTLQRDKCVEIDPELPGQPSQWCSLRQMFGIDVDPTSCVYPADAGVGGDEIIVTPPGKGCCDSSASPSSGSLATGAVVGMLLLRRRRRKSPC